MAFGIVNRARADRFRSVKAQEMAVIVPRDEANLLALLPLGDRKTKFSC